MILQREGKAFVISYSVLSAKHIAKVLRSVTKSILHPVWLRRGGAQNTKTSGVYHTQPSVPH
jgi:hypothetical protein